MKGFVFTPLQPADAGAVQDFVRALSLESRRERFFSPIAELSPGQLERIVSGPGLSLAAWRDGRIAGLAQYALGEGPAEFAVVVGEDWRGLGLGEELVRLLIADARRAGVRTLGGLTMERNRPMRRLAAKLGFVQKPDADPDLVHMERALAGA
jgi:acetyltransferase